MRKLILAIALSALPFAANAQQQSNITLNCRGTYKVGGDAPHPKSNIGVIVANATVSIFGMVFPISQATNDKIEFNGPDKNEITTNAFGSIDRVTGEMHATVTPAGGNLSWSYALHCKPATKIF
jgi:hypothetical protein